MAKFNNLKDIYDHINSFKTLDKFKEHIYLHYFLITVPNSRI